jgi:hypothetical protein
MLLLLALTGTVVGAVTGQTSVPEYRVSPGRARERALESFAEAGRCWICWHSQLGWSDPARALGNTTDKLFFRYRPESPRAGERFTVFVRPRTVDGEFVIATFVIDLGDGTYLRRERAFGDVRVDHVYARPGDYSIRAWVGWTGERPVDAQLDFRVLP